MSRYRNSSSYSEDSSDNEDVEQTHPVSNNSLQEPSKPSEVKEASEPVKEVKQQSAPTLPPQEPAGIVPSYELTWMDSSDKANLPPSQQTAGLYDEAPLAKKSKDNEAEMPLPGVPPKKKRGRPRKNPLAPPKVSPAVPKYSPLTPGEKRRPGRPRKNPLPPAGTPVLTGSQTMTAVVPWSQDGTAAVYQVKKRGRPPKKAPTQPIDASFLAESTESDTSRKRAVSDRVPEQVVVVKKRGRPPKNSLGQPSTPVQHKPQDASKPSPISFIQGQDIKALFSSFSGLGSPGQKKRGRPPKPIDAEVARLAHLCSNLRFLDKSFCGPSRDWSPQDRVQLFKVVSDLPSTTPDFWSEVSTKFASPQYSAQECQLEYQNCLLSYIYLTLNKRM